MGRSPCCEKTHTNKGAWTKEEDRLLIDYIRAHGEGCWRSLPKSAGLLRCGKSCRLRWINYLRPDLKRGNFTQEDNYLIIQLHSLLGNKWSQIANKLRRTDNEIKNYWNSHIKRKLINCGMDQLNHRPFYSTTTVIKSTPAVVGQTIDSKKSKVKNESNEGGETCNSGTTTEDGQPGRPMVLVKPQELNLELTVGLSPFQAQGRVSPTTSSAESNVLGLGPLKMKAQFEVVRKGSGCPTISKENNGEILRRIWPLGS